MSTAAETLNHATTFDVETVRAQFPALHQDVHGKPLVYLDSAASSQRAQSVIDAVAAYDSNDHANVHRGVHELSQRATDAFEGARHKVAQFLNARQDNEIIFTRGTTEAINLVAQSYGRSNLGPGDEVLITWMEHHSNIVPWQMVCEQTGATLKVARITRDGEIDLDHLYSLMNERTRVVGVVHVSNALGTVNPVKEITRKAHEHGAVVLVDGAQATPHLAVDVQDIDCDFYALSGHKMYGPTGIGALYGRHDLLNKMPPWQGGGDMILAVNFERTVYNELPYKFEAGTPNIAGAVGLGAACDFLQGVGFAAIAAHEASLLEYANQRLAADDFTIIGTAAHKSGVVSFTLGTIHPHDIGTIVDGEGVAIRTGHHCAMPVMEFFNVPATSRASFGIYTNRSDIDRLVLALDQVREVLG
ncbi:MAG: cysteine desulfurase [Gammaproteobacteria bacterium]